MTYNIEFHTDAGVAALITPRYRTRKVSLVLFGGKAGVGKTTIADYIFHELTNRFPSLSMELRGFATPVKEIATGCFKWDGVKDDKGRRLLQVIGTDAGREYNPNIWVEYMEEYILGNLFIPNVVLVDDWRFPNEKEYFEKNFMFDITTVKINRPNNPALSEESMSHISENSLPENKNYYDYVIENNGSVEELYKKLDGVIDHLSKKVITY